MFHPTIVTLLHREQLERFARINRDEWMLEALALADDSNRNRFEIIRALCRRAGGAVRLVRRAERANANAVSTAQ